MVSIGFNAILFAVLTRIYVLQAGIIPREPKYIKIFKHVNLEMGLVAGVIILLAGIIGFIISIIIWNHERFGRMDNPELTMRIVVPSVVAMSLGSQIILSSFFLSIMGIEREPYALKLF